MINLFKHTTIDLLSKTRFIPHKKKTIKIFVYLILSYLFQKGKSIIKCQICICHGAEYEIAFVEDVTRCILLPEYITSHPARY